MNPCKVSYFQRTPTMNSEPCSLLYAKLQLPDQVKSGVARTVSILVPDYSSCRVMLRGLPHSFMSSRTPRPESGMAQQHRLKGGSWFWALVYQDVLQLR